MELELEVVVISPVGVVRAQRSSHLQVTLGKLGMLNRQDCLFKEKDVSRSRGEGRVAGGRETEDTSRTVHRNS